MLLRRREERTCWLLEKILYLVLISMVNSNFNTRILSEYSFWKEPKLWTWLSIDLEENPSVSVERSVGNCDCCLVNIDWCQMLGSNFNIRISAENSFRKELKFWRWWNWFSRKSERQRRKKYWKSWLLSCCFWYNLKTNYSKTALPPINNQLTY